MKKNVNRKFTLENYLNHIICFCAGCSAAVFGVMIKMAYLIDLSSMNVY